MYRFSVAGQTPKEAVDKLIELADYHRKHPDYRGFADNEIQVPSPALIERMSAPTPFDTSIQVPDPVGTHPLIEDQDDEAPAAQQGAYDLGQRDSKGLVWDARIHSANKSFNKDGSWRIRRNLQDGLVEKIEAELRQKFPNTSVSIPVPVTSPQSQSFATQQSAPMPSAWPPPIASPAQPPMATQQPTVTVTPFVPPAIPTPPPPTMHVDVPTVHVTPPAVTAAPVQAVEAPKAYDSIPVPQGTKPAHDLASFKANFVSVISGLINEKKIDRAYIEKINSYFNIADIWLITKEDQKLEEMFNTFVDYGFITKVG